MAELPVALADVVIRAQLKPALDAKVRQTPPLKADQGTIVRCLRPILTLYLMKCALQEHKFKFPYTEDDVLERRLYFTLHDCGSLPLLTSYRVRLRVGVQGKSRARWWES